MGYPPASIRACSFSYPSYLFTGTHGLAVKGNPTACYYIGRLYLERKERKLAQSFLTTAAKGGEEEAAALLASEFGIREDLPQDSVPACQTDDKVSEEEEMVPEQYDIDELTFLEPIPSDEMEVEETSAETETEETFEEMHLLFREEDCLGAEECGLCKDYCFTDAITTDYTKNVISIDEEKCIGCGACLEECPMGAIDIL